jgi:hypothetical protein
MFEVHDNTGAIILRDGSKVPAECKSQEVAFLLLDYLMVQEVVLYEDERDVRQDIKDSGLPFDMTERDRRSVEDPLLSVFMAGAARATELTAGEFMGTINFIRRKKDEERSRGSSSDFDDDPAVGGTQPGIRLYELATKRSG